MRESLGHFATEEEAGKEYTCRLSQPGPKTVSKKVGNNGKTENKLAIVLEK